jgi:hypothetical protein
MKTGKWAWLLLAAAPLLAGCGDFWQAPGGSSTSFSLSNSGAISVSPGSSNNSTITVTPSNSFTGTVALTCAVTTKISNATSPATCSLSPTSVTISSTTAETSTLTAATTSTTSTGNYTVTVTGTSGSVSETTSVCVTVGTSSGSCSSTGGNSSGHFYILNAGTTPQIVGESIASGQLTTLSGSPWTVQGTPYAMAMAPSGNFLVVSTTSGVFTYPISSGTLGTPTVVSQDQALALQVDATDSWLVEAIPGTGGVTIAAIPINSSNGTDNGTEVTASFAVANAAVQTGKMVISQDNANIFVALGAGGTIVVPFSESAPLPSGVTATIIPVANSNGGSALSVAVAPGTSPGLFYIGETLANSGGTSGALRAFEYSSLGSSTLTQATGSPIASGGLAPNFILPVTSPGFVYIANGQGTSTAGNITGISVTASGSTYSLATGNTVAAGIQPLSLALDSTGTYVMEVGSLGSPYFDAYTFDSTTTGKLDSQITSSTSASSVAIVAAP